MRYFLQRTEKRFKCAKIIRRCGISAYSRNGAEERSGFKKLLRSKYCSLWSPVKRRYNIFALPEWRMRFCDDHFLCFSCLCKQTFHNNNVVCRFCFKYKLRGTFCTCHWCDLRKHLVIFKQHTGFVNIFHTKAGRLITANCTTVFYVGHKPGNAAQFQLKNRLNDIYGSNSVRDCVKRI